LGALPETERHTLAPRETQKPMISAAKVNKPDEKIVDVNKVKDIKKSVSAERVTKKEGVPEEFRTTSTGDTFDLNSSFSLQDFNSLASYQEAVKMARTDIQSGQAAERAQGRTIVSDIPGGAPVIQSVGAFAGADVATFEKSGMARLYETPLGQALTGKIALDKLKEEGIGENIIALTDYMLKNGLTPEQVSADPATQMILYLELNEADLALIKSGKTDISAFAQLVEGLPFIRKASGKGGGAIIPTTAIAKFDDLQIKIEKMGNKIRDYRMAAARTPAKKDAYLELIEKTESEKRNAESRAKLYVIQSPIAQSCRIALKKWKSFGKYLIVH